MFVDLTKSQTRDGFTFDLLGKSVLQSAYSANIPAQKYRDGLNSQSGQPGTQERHPETSVRHPATQERHPELVSGSAPNGRSETGTRYRYIDDTPLVPMAEAGKANGTSSSGSTAKTRSRPNNEYVLYSYGEPVGMTNDGGTSYFATDILGSVRSVTDKYGTVQADYSYDAFGSPYLGNLENDVGFGYCGKVYDVGTGLYDYGFRDYSPNNARFTTVDPIRDGANWFSYVVNDPVNYVDPLGLSTSDRGSSPKFNSGMFGQNIGGNFSTSNGWVIGNGFAIPQSGATLNGFTEASGVPWSMTSWDQSRNPKSLQVGETIFWNTNLPFSDFTVTNTSSSTSALADAKVFTLNSVAQALNTIGSAPPAPNKTVETFNIATWKYMFIENIGAAGGANFSVTVTMNGNNMSMFVSGKFLADNLVNGYDLWGSVDLIVDGSKVASSSFSYPDYDFLWSGFGEVLGNAEFNYNFSSAKSIALDFSFGVYLKQDAQGYPRKYNTKRIDLR